MKWFFYDIDNERQKEILKQSINNFDNDNDISYDNILTENEFINNQENLDIDILVINFDRKFLQRIRNIDLHMIIICNSDNDIETCLDIFIKSTKNVQIILPNEFTSTELIANFMNLERELKK